MHPEVVQDGPGSCPICGMALEPRTVGLEEEENPELVDMRRRFWIGVALLSVRHVLAVFQNQSHDRRHTAADRCPHRLC